MTHFQPSSPLTHQLNASKVALRRWGSTCLVASVSLFAYGCGADLDLGEDANALQDQAPDVAGASTTPANATSPEAQDVAPTDPSVDPEAAASGERYLADPATGASYLPCAGAGAVAALADPGAGTAAAGSSSKPARVADGSVAAVPAVDPTAPSVDPGGGVASVSAFEPPAVSVDPDGSVAAVPAVDPTAPSVDPDGSVAPGSAIEPPGVSVDDAVGAGAAAPIAIQGEPCGPVVTPTAPGSLPPPPTSGSAAQPASSTRH